MRARRPSRAPAFPRALPLLLASALPVALGAQGPAPVAVGAAVRVLAPPPETWRAGRLVALDSVALVVRGQDGAEYAIPRSLVRRVEVRTQPNRANRILGYGVLGGLAGALVGGVIGAQATGCTGCESPGIGAIVGVPVGGLAGIVVGAIVGGTTGGRWVPARLSPATTSPAAGPGADPAGTPAAPGAAAGASAGRREPRQTVTANLVAAPFGVRSAEYERAVGPRITVGVGGTHSSQGSRANDRDAWVHAKALYYPGGRPLRGVSTGATLGYHSARYFVQTPVGSAVRSVAHGSPTVGAVVDYNWRLGREERLVVGMGIGARALLRPARPQVAPVYPDGRLQLGLAL